ncbi:MAG: hypothetical protein A2096_03970 [Spirochaetes bacterium GWF1_41_5]|nr:MAG: hypothetical protein A2096_03970 [Spirochaetes bacterium GWF1_41_5]
MEKLTIESLEIHTGFDGSAPRSIGGFKAGVRNELTVFPSFHETDIGTSPEIKGIAHRLCFIIRNKGKKAAQLKININHESPDEKFLPFRDVYFFKHQQDQEWKMLPAPPLDGISSCVIGLKPGDTEFGESPSYNYGRLCKYISRIKKNSLVHADIYGKSEQGHDLLEFSISDSRYPAAGKRKAGITARNHAYETSGNYCIEGMMEFLLEKSAIASYLLSKYDFHFLPMTNVDGVIYGMTRLSSISGADHNRVNTVPDSAHRAMKQVYDREQYDVYINVHNWQNKSIDGILSNDKRFGELVNSFLPVIPDHFKIRKIVASEDWARDQGYASREELITAEPEKWEKSKSWKNYIAELKTGVNTVTFEFPWYARNTEDMKNLGKDALLAVLHADIHYNLEKAGNFK